jgi:hypothetical protein
MAELPTGTRLWEEHPQSMHGALARHDEIRREPIVTHDGHELLNALAALPVQVGDENYARLAAQGAAMGEEQIVEFAAEAMEGLFGLG